jgi:long-chain acyl-CoA synthetase
MNIVEVLEDTAREIPHKEAFVLGTRRVTFGELEETSNRVANALLELGMKKGDHVAILMSDSPEWVINYFGVVKGGGVAVLLNPKLKAPELDSLLRDSDSEILLTEKEFSQMLSSFLPQVPLLKQVIEVDSDSYANMIATSSSTSPAIDLKDEDGADIIYTSGVLGRPKGVVHTLGSSVMMASRFTSLIQQGRGDVILCSYPFYCMGGLGLAVFHTIFAGSTTVLIPSLIPKAVLQVVEKERVSIIFGVPAWYNALAMVRNEILERYNLSSLRFAVTTGAKFPPKLMKTFEEKFHIRLYELYALTETRPISVSTPKTHKLGTAGKPICELKIIDDSGKEVPDGEIGEAVVKAPWMMKEYYKAPELTAQTLKDGWFYTGDLVRMDEEGYLEYIEKESLAIARPSGVKIGAIEVESVLLSHPSVAEAAYVGIDDSYGAQIPTAFVALKEGQRATTDELFNLCYQNLADFKVPKRIEFVDSLPKTASGKIDRKNLKEREL